MSFLCTKDFFYSPFFLLVTVWCKWLTVSTFEWEVWGSHFLQWKSSSWMVFMEEGKIIVREKQLYISPKETWFPWTNGPKSPKETCSPGANGLKCFGINIVPPLFRANHVGWGTVGSFASWNLQIPQGKHWAPIFLLKEFASTLLSFVLRQLGQGSGAKLHKNLGTFP